MFSNGGLRCPAIAANQSVESSSCVADSSKGSVEVKFNQTFSLVSAHSPHSGVAEGEITETLEESDEFFCRNKGYNHISWVRCKHADGCHQ